jgi:cell envelope opacity-associated protein A
MGFWDKIKQGISQMTGNAGTMQLQLDRTELRRGESLTATFTLTSTSPFEARNVGIEITAAETVKYKVDVPNTTTTPPPAGNTAPTVAPTTTTTITTEERTNTAETYRNQQVVENTPFKLNQGESRNYTATVQVPPTAQPTYAGPAATHIWKVRAYADVPMGGDPTAEIEIHVL